MLIIKSIFLLTSIRWLSCFSIALCFTYKIKNITKCSSFITDHASVECDIKLTLRYNCSINLLFRFIVLFEISYQYGILMYYKQLLLYHSNLHLVFPFFSDWLRIFSTFSVKVLAQYYKWVFSFKFLHAALTQPATKVDFSKLRCQLSSEDYVEYDLQSS